MKSILMSIRPNWCELIANGTKTIEVRKTKPKLEPPFKVYIYCTLPKEQGTSFLVGNKNPVSGNGKVIGEFICDYILTCETEFYTENEYIVYEALYEWNVDQEVWTPLASNDDESPSRFLNDTAMDLEDFRSYLGNGENTFYAWHISDLKIYDKPKELYFFGKCHQCPYGDLARCVLHEYSCNGEYVLRRPPQSWCYVEEI